MRIWHILQIYHHPAIVILNLSFSTLKDLFKLIFLIFKPSFWFQFLAWQWKKTLQGRFYCHQKRCVNNMLIIAWLSRYNSIKRADKHDCMQTLKSHLNTHYCCMCLCRFKSIDFDVLYVLYKHDKMLRVTIISNFVLYALHVWYKGTHAKLTSSPAGGTKVSILIRLQ